MFIPIGADNARRRRFPFVVFILIAINAFVWYLQLTFGESFMAAFAAVPFQLSSGTDLVRPVAISIRGEHVVMPASIVLGMWIVMQLVGQVGSAAGQESGVAYMAHIGGFVVGLVASAIALKSSASRRERN